MWFCITGSSLLHHNMAQNCPKGWILTASHLQPACYLLLGRATEQLLRRDVFNSHTSSSAQELADQAGYYQLAHMKRKQKSYSNIFLPAQWNCQWNNWAEKYHMLDKAVTLKLNCPHLYWSVSITTSISHQTTWRNMWIDNCGKMFGFGHGKLNAYVTLTQFTMKYLLSEVKTLKTFIITSVNEHNLQSTGLEQKAHPSQTMPLCTLSWLSELAFFCSTPFHLLLSRAFANHV